ncbi:hypothetical protein OQI87_09260, partial [Lactobacillus kefiranofaciens]|nr:hypothetical protein [Lactobacillus kefiranofaciens]
MVLDQRSVMDNYLLRLNLGDAKYQTSLVYGVRGSGKTVFLCNENKQLGERTENTSPSIDEGMNL